VWKEVSGEVTDASEAFCKPGGAALGVQGRFPSAIPSTQFSWTLGQQTSPFRGGDGFLVASL
jgi:hypothetical protein